MHVFFIVWNTVWSILSFANDIIICIGYNVKDMKNKMLIKISILKFWCSVISCLIWELLTLFYSCQLYFHTLFYFRKFSATTMSSQTILASVYIQPFDLLPAARLPCYSLQVTCPSSFAFFCLCSLILFSLQM